MHEDDFRLSISQSINQSISQFNSNLAAREPDIANAVGVEIIDKNSKRNKQCAYIMYICGAWERCVEWVMVNMPVLLRCYSSLVYPAVTQFCLMPK